MPVWFYLNRPTNLSFHDFTTVLKPPQNLRRLLGLGLKFIPTPRYTQQGSSTDFKNRTIGRFHRDLLLKSYHGSAPMDDGDYNPRMYVKSKWTPPPWTIPKIIPYRFPAFDKAVQKTFRKRLGHSNLLPSQRLALQSLQQQQDIIVAQCDKNLGPATIETTRYIEMIFRDHLNDEDTYRFLTPATAASEATRLRRALKKWIADHKDSLSDNEKRFLRTLERENKHPFPVFYATLKAHKSPLKTRPIVSCSGSLLYGLGVWVDAQLQVVAQQQLSYFKSSAELKDDLTNSTVPPNTLLFTADAVSYYTNIPTAKAIEKISLYLRGNESSFGNLPLDALIEALTLVMTNNIFSFGDTTWLQLNGTAMGTPPAPPYAQIYFSILENEILHEFSDNLWKYRRFIDDIGGGWIVTDPATDDARWASFQQRLNDDEFEITWEVNARARSINFMDLTISISPSNTIITTLYEKPSNLHLYIPPHSAHPPGLLSGLVNGTLYRLKRLCTDPLDIQQKAQQFYHRLRARGYQKDVLLPFFRRAAQATSQAAATDPDPPIFFHVEYHPNGPAPHEIQKIWKETLYTPPFGRPLASYKTGTTGTIGNLRMITCFSRPPNLGNLLSYRKINTGSGPPVSSYRRIRSSRPLRERERERAGIL